MKRIILLQILLLGSVAAAATDPNLVGWWKFDDGNGTIAYDSAGSDNGTIYGATWTTGLIGGALGFNGINDYVEVNNVIKNYLGTNYTVSAWIKTDTLSGYHEIATFRDSVPQALQPPILFQLDQMNADIRFIVVDNAHTMVVATYPNVLTTGNWCHVAGVRAGNILKVYINGVSGAPVSGPLTGSINSDNFKIGALLCCGGPIDHFFDGAIDDVRVYNRALSDEEIQQLAHPVVTDPNLVGWWKFDEGTGTVAVDSAGAHNGTIYGATWVAGKIGGGMSFDGVHDYINVPDSPALRFTQNSSFTLCSWINPISSADQGIILGKWQTSGSYDLFTYNMDWWFSSKSVGFGICQSGRAYVEMGAPTGVAPVGIWSHIACVYDNRNMKIYVNGELKASGYFPYETGTNTADNNLGIGAGLIGSGVERYFGGTIDDVRIYNRALSADEIQQIYTGEEVNEPILTGLKITGPNEVPEESTASYKAIAQYDNGATKDVTALAEWRVEPNNVADINGGQLATGQALYPKQKIKIYADYTENQIDVNAQKQVSVIAICPQGNALMFDGLNDYVQIPNGPNNQITTNQMSISAWIKLNRDVGPTQRRIICKQQTDPRSWGLEIGGNGYAGLVGNQVVFHDSSGSAYRNCISPMNLIPGQWYHIGVSDNAGKIRLYINGQLSQSIDNGYGILSQITAPVMIGRANPDSKFYFDGIIDEVAVFNRALSADEIQSIMNAKLAGSEPNLVAYWNFDEGMGQIANDVSGHGNNGILGSSAGIDAADPCWVISDAPVGRCTTEQVLLRNLLGATDDKKTANQLIAGAKAKERASVSLIDEMQQQTTDANQQDAFKAKARISVAIVQEEFVSRQIDMTIKRLEEALRLLDYVVDSNSEPPLPKPWGWQWQWSCSKKDKDVPAWTPSFNNKPGGKK